MAEFNEHQVVQKFTELYRQQPLVVRSPGRINLIGEHTDYNDGFVMPAAIDRQTVFAVAQSNDGTASLYALKYDEHFVIDLRDPRPVKAPVWANYLLGVLRQFIDRGYAIKPFHCVFGGNIPTGAGLSSSASVECGFAFALNELHGHRIPKLQLVQMAQWSEHNFVGVKCGIMDQFASMMGEENQVIVLDCRSLSYRYSPLPLAAHDIVLCDTRVKHSLVDSEYNTRRSECEEGVKILQHYAPSVRSLRDASEALVRQHQADLRDTVYRRCLYVVQEIARVQQAAEDLAAHNLAAFGLKMFDTHEGLSKLYEVSCPELDFLVDEARAFPGVLGSRMMGGGFGGCTINLVEKGAVNEFIAATKDAYSRSFDREMGSYVVGIRAGVGIAQQPIRKISLL